MVIFLEQGADDLHLVYLMPLPPIISCFVKIQNGLTFLMPPYPGCPGKEVIKRVSVIIDTFYIDSLTVWLLPPLRGLCFVTVCLLLL